MPGRASRCGRAGHDLNNVFETIAEAAELLSDEECAAPLAAAIARSVERGRRLVDGFADQHYAPVDLAVVVDRAADFVRDLTVLMGRPAVLVVRDLSSSLKLKGPDSEWERVFMNLFLNAAQAMPAGGRITVAVSRHGESAEIMVADEGPGIARELLDRLFEPFLHPQPAPGARPAYRRYHRAPPGREVLAGNRADGSGAEFRILLPRPAV